MSTLRDQGNTVYEADRVIDRTAGNSSQYTAGSGADAAPSGSGAGFSLDGWNDFLLSMTVDGAVTDYQWKLWFYDGRNWKLIEDSSTLTGYDPTADFDENYYCVNWTRGYVQMMNCTGGTGIDVVGNRGL